MSAPQVDPRLTLKVTPPRPRRASAPRAWLARNCGPLRDRSIAVIHAPGGFGKTTLLAEWRRELLARGTNVGWLLLDRRDDGAGFVAGLVACLRIAVGDPRFGMVAAQAARQPEGEIVALTALLADITLLAHPVALLFDDAHELPAATAEELIPYLLHNRPPNLEFVFGTREPLRLATSELAARGDLIAVTPRDLRLRLEETIEFMRARVGGAVNLDVCARIHEIAEGWPIAVQLLAALVESDPGIDLATIEGSSQDVSRFFEETVLARLPPREAEFVVACSVLDALHPDLCRATTGKTNATVLLDRVQRTTPIFTAVEGDVWLRMHPLARSAFAPQFAALPADDRQALHWRAAQWLQKHGDPEAASRHALAAGQAGAAYEWMGAHMYALVLAGHISAALAWAERLPPDVIALPRVRLALAWAHTVSYEAAMVQHRVGELDADASADLRFEYDLIRATLAIYADDLAVARDVIESRAEESTFDLPHMRQIHANIASYLMLEAGDAERARHRQALMQASRTAGEHTMPSLHGDLIVMLSYLQEGRPRLAEASARPTLARVEAKTGRRSAASCILAPALAAAYWEQDRRDDAEATLAYRIDVIERTAAPPAVVIAHVIQARGAVAAGDEARAVETLERLRLLGEERRQPRLVVEALAEQVRLHAARRRGETCELLVERLDGCLAESKFANDRYRALGEIAHARMGIANGDRGAARTALLAARSLARKARHTRDWLEARVLLALVSEPEDAETIASLRESLSIAEANGLVRLFADAHPQLLDLLRAFVARHPPAEIGVSSPFLDRVLGKLHETASREPSRPRERVTALALLTAKEAAILELLTSGMSNKEIARAVDVGQETVKWHLKNLFGKLHAGGRRHAVDRARALGLLSA